MGDWGEAPGPFRPGCFWLLLLVMIILAIISVKTGQFQTK